MPNFSDYNFSEGGPAFAPDMFHGSRLRWLGKGGAPPRNRKLERMQEQLIKAQLKQSQTVMEFPEIPIPEPTPPDAPPPGQTSGDQMDAEQAARKQAAKRRGVQSTLLSATNAPTNPAGSAMGGGATLLGGN